MQAFFALATFTTSPQLLADLTFTNSIGGTVAVNPAQCSRIYVEPASGSHVMFIEVAGLATGADGSTAGVIRQLAAYSATGPLDSWEIADQKGGNQLTLSEYAVDGTAAETARVTIYVG